MPEAILPWCGDYTDCEWKVTRDMRTTEMRTGDVRTLDGLWSLGNRCRKRRAIPSGGRRLRDGIEAEATLDEIDQKLLRVKTVSVAQGCQTTIMLHTDVFSRGKQHACLQRIGEIGRDHFGEDLAAESVVPQMKNHFNALVDIPLHPIGAAEVGFHSATVGEDEDAAVFEKAP